MLHIALALAYQFSSSRMSRVQLRSEIVSGAEDAEAQLSQDSAGHIIFEHNFLELRSGESLNQQIRDFIDNSDICIFELSELNNNVFYEMGYAAGREKVSIYLLNSDIDINRLPSDISGLF